MAKCTKSTVNICTFCRLISTVNSGIIVSEVKRRQPPRRKGNKTMKIRIRKDDYKWLTIAEMPIAKTLQQMYKDYDFRADAAMMARVASGTYGSFEILKCEPRISGNCRIYDAHDTNSGRLDIWVDAYAYNSYYGFYEFGFYLTDAWQVTGDNNDEIRKNMFVKAFIAK